jgi:ABC-type bacteriocin/lantibiotic exporter with double-glycine peptidase domain
VPLLANRANSTDMSERRGDLLSSEMHWLGRYARPLRSLLFVDLLCMIVGSALSLLDPLIVKWLIDVALPSHTLRPVLLGTLIFCLIYVASLGINYLSSFLSCLVTQKMVFGSGSPFCAGCMCCRRNTAEISKWETPCIASSKMWTT